LERRPHDLNASTHRRQTLRHAHATDAATGGRRWSTPCRELHHTAVPRLCVAGGQRDRDRFRHAGVISRMAALGIAALGIAWPRERTAAYALPKALGVRAWFKCVPAACCVLLSLACRGTSRASACSMLLDRTAGFARTHTPLAPSIPRGDARPDQRGDGCGCVLWLRLVCLSNLLDVLSTF